MMRGIKDLQAAPAKALVGDEVSRAFTHAREVLADAYVAYIQGRKGEAAGLMGDVAVELGNARLAALAEHYAKSDPVISRALAGLVGRGRLKT